jgi:hypothetical protein
VLEAPMTVLPHVWAADAKSPPADCTFIPAHQKRMRRKTLPERERKGQRALWRQGNAPRTAAENTRRSTAAPRPCIGRRFLLWAHPAGVCLCIYNIYKIENAFSPWGVQPRSLNPPDFGAPMRVGPQAPLGFRAGLPQGTCRHTHADRRARLRQTILLPVTHFAASAVPRAVVRAPKSHSIRASCWIRRFHAQTPAPSALAARLFPYSPPKRTFALLAEYRGLPVTPPAEHAKPVDLLANPRATGCCEARETPFRRKGDDAALMPRRSGSIAGLSCAWDVHASLGLCRSLLPLLFDLEKSPDMEGASRRARASRAHPI